MRNTIKSITIENILMTGWKFLKEKQMVAIKGSMILLINYSIHKN
jgi:hypothetical protein